MTRFVPFCFRHPEHCVDDVTQFKAEGRGDGFLAGFRFEKALLYSADDGDDASPLLEAPSCGEAELVEALDGRVATGAELVPHIPHLAKVDLIQVSLPQRHAPALFVVQVLGPRWQVEYAECTPHSCAFALFTWALHRGALVRSYFGEHVPAVVSNAEHLEHVFCNWTLLVLRGS